MTEREQYFSTKMILGQSHFLSKCLPQLFSLILLTISPSIEIKSQNTFFKIFESDYCDQSFGAIETSAGEFIIVGERALSWMEDSTYAYILKINSTGDFIKDTIIGSEGVWSRNTFIKPIPNSMSQYLVGGWTDSTSLGVIYNSTSLQIFDDEIQLKSCRRYNSPFNDIHHSFNAELIEDSILYVISYFFPQLTNTQFAVVKYQFPYDSLLFYGSYPPIIHCPFDLQYIKQDTTLQVFYLGPSISEDNPIKILQLDLNLNYNSTDQGPPYMSNSVCANIFNDTSYLLTGSGSSPNVSPNHHIFVYLLNNDNDTLKQLEYFNHPDTILYAGGGTNTVIQNNSIFITGIYNMDPSAPYLYQTTPTWIQLTKTDLDLNIISNHFYGGDKLYISYSTIPVSDGGVLVTGFSWDYNIPDNKSRKIFVLKVDTAGLVTDIQENSKWRLNDAILCPNPGSDYFIAIVGTQHSIATLYLYDIAGRQIFEQKLYQTQTRINSESIPSGTYIYRFIASGKEIGSGKWVKQ